MLLFCVFILICCTVLHFYNHFTFQKTKKCLFKISAKNEYHGPYPVVFIIYCVLQIFYSIHLITYFAIIAIPSNIQSVNIMDFLLYPFSLLHTNTSSGSVSITKENILYSNIYNLLHLNCNYTSFTSQIDPFLIINIICFVILFLFEGFFNFYRFYGVYNVSKFLISATLSETLKKYAIYCFLFLVVSILNVAFNNIFFVFVIFCLHMSFNIYCEYKQISILLNQHVTDAIDNIINPNEFTDILQPLYVCRRLCVIATIFSSIYLLGIYGFTDDTLFFLLFYPIFFCIITTLQTMVFIRNRSFLKTKILVLVCCCVKRKVKDPQNTSTFNVNSSNNNTQKTCINMTPIGEEIEAQVIIKDIDIDIEIMHQHISGGPNESAESGEISGLLTSKNIGSPSAHSISVDENDELIDFTDIIIPPSKATKYLSSPSAPARQSSANNININIGKLRSAQKSKSNDDKYKYNYNLQSDDLSLTLTMLVNSGLVKQENAMHLKSLRKKNRRKQNMQKENESNIVQNKNGQDERIFLVMDINDKS